MGKRKPIGYEYHVQGLWAQGWETESITDVEQDALDWLKDYRRDVPFVQYRIKKVPIYAD